MRKSIHVETLLGDVNVRDFISGSAQIQPYPPVNFFNILPNIIKDEDIIFFAGAASGPKRINFLNCDSNTISNYLIQQYKPGMNIFFDNTFEGYSGCTYAKIHNILKLSKLPSNSFYYINGLTNPVETYEMFCSTNNITEKINVLGVHWFEFYSQNTLRNLPKNTQTQNLERGKTYLCFNRILREHRAFLLGLLFKENLVTNNYYSFFPEGTHNNRYKASPINSLLQGLTEYGVSETLIEDTKIQFDTHRELLPLTLNIKKEVNKIIVDIADFQYFNDTLFSLVTETYFFQKKYSNYLGYDVTDYDGIFFSEKIFKPIIMNHPFILVSRPKSLDFLRKLGYKTFHPYIDESYDTIENDQDRMLAIVKEVKRLSMLSPSERIDWLKFTLPIAAQNSQTLKNKRYGDFVGIC